MQSNDDALFADALWDLELARRGDVNDDHVGMELIEYGPVSDEARAAAVEVVDTCFECFGMDPGPDRENAINYVGRMIDRSIGRHLDRVVEVEIIVGEEPSLTRKGGS